MAAESVPIDPGTCNECDLCCVLNVVEHDGCFNLFWQCNCPGGTRVMQWFDPFSGWNDVTGWAQDGANYWYPWNNFAVPDYRANSLFRLKCTLASGEIYYSNSVSCVPTTTWNPFQCADSPVDVKTYGAEVDYSVQPYTASGPYPGTVAWGTEVDYTAGISGVGGLATTLYTFTPTGDFIDAVLIHQGPAFGGGPSPGAEIRCSVRINGLGANWQARRDLSDLTKGWRCFDNCPSFDEFLAIPSDYYFCSAFSGTPPNTYCSSGVKFRVKEIRIVTS